MRAMVMGVVAMVSTGVAAADTIAYWNFNDSGTGAPNLTVDAGAGTLTSDATSLTTFGGTTINSLGGDPDGAANRAFAIVGTANNNKHVTFRISTTGFENLSLSFATQRTTTGFSNNAVAWSVNGTDFTNFGSYNPALNFATQSFDFSGVTGLRNSSSVFVRIVFSGTTSANGNNHIDNVLFTADPIVIPLPPAAFAGIAGLGLAGIASRIRRR